MFCVDDLSNVLGAISHPVRRAILSRLAGGSARVTEIAAPFDVSLNAVSKHLKVLESAELIARERRGNFQIVRLNPTALRSAEQWLTFYEKFWSTQLDALQTHLEGEKHGDNNNG